MKKNDRFMLSEALDSYVLVPYGEKQISFAGIIVLNDTAKFLWEKVEGEFEKSDLIKWLCDEYEIDEATAEKSADKFITMLKEVGAIE